MTHKERTESVQNRMAAQSVRMGKMQQERMLGIGAYLLWAGAGCLVYAFTGSFALALGFCCIVSGIITINSVAKTQAEEKNKDGV